MCNSKNLLPLHPILEGWFILCHSLFEYKLNLFVDFGGTAKEAKTVNSLFNE
jgi:hypothetical protein